MSKHEMYFAVECWENVPGEDDRRIHVRLHIGSEAGLREIWRQWNEKHPDRIRYDRIISRRTSPEQAIDDISRHLVLSRREKMIIE